MGTIDLKYSSMPLGKYSYNSLTEDQFKQFNMNLLDLGKVSKEAKVINTFAAIFDLEGFTEFCNQIDPQLVVPDYLNDFLQWLFDSIAQRFSKEKKEGRVFLWGSLPFFGKFTGDGVLFLWNTDLSKGLPGIGNIVAIVSRICQDYETTFRKKATQAHAKVPRRLRAGLARGHVLSIGGGKDYVGPCINMAARLQKLATLSLAVSRRGFDPEKCFSKDTAENYVVKKTTIRGIGKDELIVIRKKEYELLSDKDKRLFK